MNVQAVVEKLGFRPAEARVYIALIGIAEVAVSDLARRLGMPRTTVQGILEDLHERGLVTCYSVRRRKVWSAEHPRKLLSRHQQLERQLNDLIPALERMQSHRPDAIKTLMYEGRSGVRFILDDVLATREHVLLIGSIDVIRSAVGEVEWGRFVHTCSTSLPGFRVIGTKSTDGGWGSIVIREHAACVPESTAAICVYGARVAIIHSAGNVPTVTIMHNAAVADLIRGVHGCMWEKLLQ